MLFASSRLCGVVFLPPATTLHLSLELLYNLYCGYIKNVLLFEFSDSFLCFKPVFKASQR